MSRRNLEIFSKSRRDVAKNELRFDYFQKDSEESEKFGPIKKIIIGPKFLNFSESHCKWLNLRSILLVPDDFCERSLAHSFPSNTFHNPTQNFQKIKRKGVEIFLVKRVEIDHFPGLTGANCILLPN